MSDGPDVPRGSPKLDIPRDSGVQRRGVQGLRNGQIAGIVAALVLLFLFVNGPVWQHPYEANLSILLSYAPIPVVVAGALVWVRRFSLLAWLVDTLLVAITKFGITATILLALWSFSRPPTGLGGSSAGSPRPREHDGPAVVRKLAPDEGRGAAVQLTIDERGFAPARATLHVGQPLEIRATGGGLHTVALTRGSTTLFNSPVLSDGRPTRLEVVSPIGAVTLRCTVHAESRHEQTVALDVVR